MPQRIPPQHSYLRILLRAGVIAVVSLLGVTTPSRAQQTEQPQQTSPVTPPQQTTPVTPPQQTTPVTPPQTTGGTATGDPAQGDPKPVVADITVNDRIFGVLPNYGTVEGTTNVAPITTGQSFKMAALGSFDPFMFPLFGFVAGVAHVQDQPASYTQDFTGYAQRYGLAFADNTVCSLVTTGILPSLLKTDPRYFQLGKGGFFYRLGYSASRSVVTHTRKGRKTFNLAEVAGTLVVATVSNLYYPQEERTVPATFARWGSQAMWDTVANELKEFWPDIRRKMHPG